MMPEEYRIAGGEREREKEREGGEGDVESERERERESQFDVAAWYQYLTEPVSVYEAV